MRKKPLSAAVLTVAILALVFAIQAPAATMTLTSSAFANGGRIPDKYTNDRPYRAEYLPAVCLECPLGNSILRPFHGGPSSRGQ